MAAIDHAHARRRRPAHHHAGRGRRAARGVGAEADAGPFSSLAVLDRLLYDSFDPFAALAAAAAVTERIRLATMIVTGPLRATAMLVKDAASVQALSAGRLTLGLAIGARHDDYEAAGVPHKGRGARLSDQLAELHDWDASTIVPGAIRDRRPVLLVGGASAAAFARMARYADGYIHGGGPPRAFARAATSAPAAWIDSGGRARRAVGSGLLRARRRRRPREAYLRDYYAFTGPFAAKVAAGNLTSARAVRDFVRAYEEAGCDELVLLPTVSDLGQLDRLADVLARGSASSAPGRRGSTSRSCSSAPTPSTRSW